MKKISETEWKKRLEEVIEASKSSKTIKEIIVKTEYSRPIISTIFKKFPEEEKIVRENLKKSAKSKIHNSVSESNEKIILIDSSLYSYSNVFEVLEKYVKDGYKIGITDFVLDEIDEFYRRKYELASQMLSIIFYNISYFKLFEEKEEQGRIERIINSCLKHKTELASTDKRMCIQAVLKGVKTKYIRLEKEDNIPVFEVLSDEKIKKRGLAYIPNVITQNNELIFIDDKKQFIKVFNRAWKPKEGDTIVLEEGDHVLRAKEKRDVIVFVHYEICTTSSRFCSYIRNKYNAYKCDPIIKIGDTRFKKFLEEAKRFFNC